MPGPCTLSAFKASLMLWWGWRRYKSKSSMSGARLGCDWPEASNEISTCCWGARTGGVEDKGGFDMVTGNEPCCVRCGNEGSDWDARTGGVKEKVDIGNENEKSSCGAWTGGVEEKGVFDLFSTGVEIVEG